LYTGAGNGFSFANYNAQEMADTIIRALLLFKDKERWNTVVKSAMSKDYSWQSSAQQYRKVYETMIGS